MTGAAGLKYPPNDVTAKAFRRAGLDMRSNQERLADVELVPDPGAALEKETKGGHIRKRKRRKSGARIDFDPEQLRKYVTGFRKRKQERREHAKKKIAELEKKAKRIKRKEHEQALKVRCGMRKNDSWLSSSESEPEGKPIKKTEVYTTAEFKTVVHVEPFTLGPTPRCNPRAPTEDLHQTVVYSEGEEES